MGHMEPCRAQLTILSSEDRTYSDSGKGRAGKAIVASRQFGTGQKIRQLLCIEQSNMIRQCECEKAQAQPIYDQSRS